MQRRVSRRHASLYPDPIRVEEGEAFRLTDRSELWDGHRWLWAVAEDGREGWVPDDLPARRPDATVAAYAYSARELDVEPEQSVQVTRTSHGWAWCVDDRGNAGWVPLSALADP
ncbi:MAG: SH3 domain-containing protein [Inquilinaceae bacterium]